MKAILYQQYGPPEVAHLTEVEKPVVKPHDVLIRVMASTVNRTDAGFRSAEYFISRFWSGLFRPKHQILGCEFAGKVEAVGSMVTLFKKGDRVFGFNDQHFGGHAEYLCINEHAALATIPETMGYAEAAALTEGAHYALVDIRAAGITAGQNVMVYGASGAIGSAAVQLLKHFGARVTAVAGTAHQELLRSLGADEIIDYQREDYTQTTHSYSLILDAVGKISFGACRHLLTPNGVYISTELGKKGENIFYALYGLLHGGKRVLFPIPSINSQDVQFLKSLAEQQKLRPVIDRHYRMEEITEAYRYVESGQKIGNVILDIANDSDEQNP